ncbi:hypothetical protein H0X32_03380 [Patescibacteria group bacterium]|nr:hypothetical protein [Patescibacteria group bacterium]
MEVNRPTSAEIRKKRLAELAQEQARRNCKTGEVVVFGESLIDSPCTAHEEFQNVLQRLNGTQMFVVYVTMCESPDTIAQYLFRAKGGGARSAHMFIELSLFSPDPNEILELLRDYEQRGSNITPFNAAA